MKKIKYTGAPGFTVAGLGELEPGKTYELEDEQLAQALTERPDFEEVGAKKTSKKGDDS